MINKDSKYYNIVQFFIRFFILYIIWFCIYDLYLRPRGYLDKYLIISQTNTAGKILEFINYKTYISFYNNIYGIITFENGSSLKVSHYCDGLVLFALFAGFIISFPGGDWKVKFKHVLVGIGIIYIANIIRIVILSIIFVEARQYLDFNHKYVFTSIIYTIIFLMWKYWIDKAILKKQNRIIETSV